jgi:hypothetical protein
MHTGTQENRREESKKALEDSCPTKREMLKELYIEITYCKMRGPWHNRSTYLYRTRNINVSDVGRGNWKRGFARDALGIVGNHAGITDKPYKFR